MSSPTPTAFARGGYPVSNLPDDGQILAVHFPHWVSPVAADMVAHPGIVDVVSTVAGAHLPEWDGAAKCMQSMLFFKPPGLQGQAWHQDERFIPTRDRSLVGAWIALDDATIDNGCLWVIPGSHRTGRLFPTRDHGRPDEFDPTDEAYGFDDEGAVAVEVEAGTVVFFNGYLLHRSLRNRSDGTRMALVNHYMNAWSPLPWMMHDGVDVATADYRTITSVSGDDPYPERGITDPPATAFVRPSEGRVGVDVSHRPVDEIEHTVRIEAPMDVVWSTLTDLAAYGTWNPYLVRVDGAASAGTTATVTARPTGSNEITYDVEVVEIDAPVRMVWEGGFDDRTQWRGVHTWELTADDGATILRQHETFWGSQAAAILDATRDAIAADFERSNLALRRAALTAGAAE